MAVLWSTVRVRAKSLGAVNKGNLTNANSPTSSFQKQIFNTRPQQKYEVIPSKHTDGHSRVKFVLGWVALPLRNFATYLLLRDRAIRRHVVGLRNGCLTRTDNWPAGLLASRAVVMTISAMRHLRSPVRPSKPKTQGLDREAGSRVKLARIGGDRSLCLAVCLEFSPDLSNSAGPHVGRSHLDACYS